MKTFEFIRSGLVLAVIICLSTSMGSSSNDFTVIGIVLCVILLLMQVWFLLFCREAKS
jgi:hypothetical protein